MELSIFNSYSWFVLKDLSIITVNYRNWEKLSQCLDSLSSITEAYFTFEVIVVDNSSEGVKVNEFRQRYPKFNFISNGGNYGFANGNNLGAANSNGKYLLFLNPDTQVSEKALLAMLDQTKVSRSNSIISCRQKRANGKEDKPYGFFPSTVTLTGWSRAIAKLFKIVAEPSYNERLIYPEWVSGSVMMMSKTSFNRIGMWNERFWMYFEDVDLCRRANELGGAIILLKNVSVIHNHGGSSRSDVEIASLTKTEVNISLHEYLSLHENGIKEVLMHAFLVLNNLISGLVLAIPGLILFTNKRLLISTRAYIKLLNYYFKAFLLDTWISPRSLKHPESYHFGHNLNKNLAALRDENS